jgi:hypothetical protein
MVWLMGEKQSNARGTPVGKGAARTLQKPHYPESFLLLLRSMQQFVSPLSSSRILPSAGVIRNNWNPCQAFPYSVEGNPFVGFTATIASWCTSPFLHNTDVMVKTPDSYSIRVFRQLRKDVRQVVLFQVRGFPPPHISKS